MIKRMTVASVLGGAILFALAALMLTSSAPAPLHAQGPAATAKTTPPDFSGVYYPLNPFGGGKGGAPKAAPPKPKGPPARPTQSAPLSDGSQGRSPDAPSLQPEYMAKWEMIRKSRISGSYEYDPNAKCLPPGMPAMMNMAYGMEIMQTKDKITFFSELNDALRRVFLDGRKPSQKVLDDPTYAGFSMGHWEGDTLVVETVALRDDTFIEGFTPHSDAMTVHERIRLAEPDLLEDRITVTDPKALTKPWETVKRYRRAKPPNDELREFACPEGLGEAR
jgi:hypothetical protein